MIVGTLNYSLIFVAFPELQREFDAPSSRVSWAMTAFSITVAALTMPCGWLADRVGRKRQFLIGVGIFAIGSTLVALAPSLGFLVAARVLQAAGLAAEAPAAQAIVLAAFPIEKRSTAVGAIGSLGGMFSAVGPVIGGALLDSVGWRWTFASTIPISVATIVIGARWLPDVDPTELGRQQRAFPDAVGVACLILGVSSLALGIVQADDWGWTDLRTLGALTTAIILLSALVQRSQHHPDPILDLGLWKQKNFRLGTLLGFVVSGHFGSVFLTSMLLLTEVWGLSRFRGGLAVAFIPCIAGPLTFAAGRWADRHGHSKVILPGCVLFIAAGLFFVAVIGEERQLLEVWIPGVVLYAAAVGLSHAACQSVALAAVQADRLGTAGATARIFTDIGNTIWVAVSIAIVAAAPDTITGVKRVFTTMILVGIVGGLLAMQLERPSRPQEVKMGG
jgi:EmrB/QacA subfamily drug resistance transporter